MNLFSTFTIYRNSLKNTIMKKKLLFISLLLFSAITFSQENRDIITSYLLVNKEKFQLGNEDIQGWIITDEVYSKKSQITHVYIQQTYRGIPIFNAVGNISIKENKVIHQGISFINNVATKTNLIVPTLNPKAAIERVASKLELGIPSSIDLLETKSENHFIYSKSGISQEKIPVELVYQLMSDASLKLSWKLNVHQLDGLHWWNVRIDANSGLILDMNDWGVNCNFDFTTKTHNHKKAKKNETKKRSLSETFSGEKYNVFAAPVESPNHGSRSLLTDPSNEIASPFGWHDTDGVDGNEFTITRGNNVYVQLDDDGINSTFGYAPDGGATLDFDFSLDLVDVTPDTYVDVSLTNLFYVNNIMHDIWYQYGFDEASGNFQANNYGNGGAENDYVIADGQDASGRNNANFSTPPDGTRPRMQMFIWDIDDIIHLNNSSLQGTYTATDANFTIDGTPDTIRTGAPVFENPVTADLILANDGSASPTEACNSSAIINDVAGKIVVIRRGSCSFVSKIELVQQFGAVGVIIVNNEPGDLRMGGPTTNVNIPAVSVSQSIGETIITALENGEIINTTLVDYGIDSSLDNGIVAHEYGHGISVRLVGGPNNSNCLTNSEQLGEGWSDFFGLVITMESGDSEDDIRGFATYSDGQPTDGTGIRGFPYTTDMSINPFTFNDVQNQLLTDGSASVHGVGSIWATMLWDLNWAMIDEYGFDPDFYNGTGGNNKTMELVIEGLKLTPCGSGFVGARDAIIAADLAINGGINRCLIWGVFARRGLGFSASSGSTTSITDQVEAFDVPSDCVLSIIEEDLENFKIFPNPSDGDINISALNNIENATITIYDLNGRKVYAKKLDIIGSANIKAGKLASGIYVIRINNGTFNYSKKIIIR